MASMLSDPCGSRAYFARAAGGIALLAGLAMLFAWLAGFDAVKTPPPGAGNMKANTALCFAACGTALWSSTRAWRS